LGNGKVREIQDHQESIQLTWKGGKGECSTKKSYRYTKALEKERCSRTLASTKKSATRLHQGGRGGGKTSLQSSWFDEGKTFSNRGGALLKVDKEVGGRILVAEQKESKENGIRERGRSKTVSLLTGGEEDRLGSPTMKKKRKWILRIERGIGFRDHRLYASHGICNKTPKKEKPGCREGKERARGDAPSRGRGTPMRNLLTGGGKGGDPIPA